MRRSGMMYKSIAMNNGFLADMSPEQFPSPHEMELESKDVVMK